MRRLVQLPLVCFLISSVLSHGQTANDDAVTVTINDAARIPVLANDEAGGFPLNRGTVEVVSSPGVAGASLNIDSVTGDIVYQSGTSSAGSDSFSYRVKDSAGNLSNTATVSVTRNVPTRPTSGSVFALPGTGADVAVPATIGTSGHWFIYGTSGSTALRQSSEGIFFQNDGPNDFRKVAVKIDPASLSNSGSSISADFDFQLMNYDSTDPDKNGYKFRFGFWDSTDSGKGYFVRMDAGTVEGNTASLNSGGDSLGGSSNQIGQTADPGFVATSERRSGTLKLTRIDDEVVVRLTVDGLVLEKRDAADLFDEFDHFGFLIPADFGDGGSDQPTIGVISNVSMNHDAGSGPVAPVATNDSTSVVQGGNVLVDVLSNDSDSNLNILSSSVQISSQPSSGSVTVDPETGEITYAHHGGELGDDSFRYTVADTGGLVSSSATVNVSVSARLQVGVGTPVTVPSDGTCFDVPYTVGENGVWFMTGAQSNAEIGVDSATLVMKNNSSGTASADDFRRAVISLAANGGIDLTNPGSFLTAKFTVRMRNYDPRSSDNPDRRFRFGFWDSNSLPTTGRGYTIRMDAGTAVTQSIDVRKGGDRLGGNADITTTLGTPGTGSAFVARNTDKEVELTLKRTTPTQLDLTVKVGNDEYFQTDSSDLLSTFNHFGFMVPKDGNGVEATLSNVQICFLGAAVIPPTAPNVEPDGGSTIQGENVSVDVLANDNDVNFDLDPTSVVIASDPAFGSVSVDGATGIITYAHAGGTSVSDSFTYTVSDLGGLESSPAVVNIGVTAQENINTGSPVSLLVDGSSLDVPATLGQNGVWHNIGAVTDSNIDITSGGGVSLKNNSSSDDFRRAAINLVTSGTINLDNPGSTLTAKFKVSLIGYDPRPSDSPDRRFRFGFWNSSDDGKGYTVRMDPGAAVPDSIDVRGAGDRLGGQGATIGSPSGDTDFFVGTSEKEIELTLNRTTSSDIQISVELGNGKVFSVTHSSSIFDTSSLFSVFDYFGFMVPKDGTGVEAILNDVEIEYLRGPNVSPMAPVADNDSDTVVQGSNVVVDVLDNDSDQNRNLDPGSVTIVSNPQKGSVSVNLETGEITYSHAGGPTGADTFSYRVKDSGGLSSNTATVTIGSTSRLQVANGATFFVPSTGSCVDVPLTIGENGVWHQISNADGSEIDIVQDQNSIKLKLENNNSGNSSSEDFRRAGISIASLAGGSIDLATPGASVTVKFEVRMDYTPRSGIDDPDRRFRFGFWNTSQNGAGYTARIDARTATGGTVDIRKGGNFLGGNSTTVAVAGTDPLFFIGSSTQSLEYTLTRESATAMRSTVTIRRGGINQAIFQALDPSLFLSSFDYFGFMVPKDGNGVEAFLSNVEICYNLPGSASSPLGQYQAWLNAVSSLSGGDATLTANPDQDELDNLLEYAIGGEPDQFTLDTGLNLISAEANGDDEVVYDVTFRRRVDRAGRGLTYTVEAGNDLEGYSAVSGNVLSAINGNTGYQTVTVRFTEPVSSVRRFFRLRVELAQ